MSDDNNRSAQDAFNKSLETRFERVESKIDKLSEAMIGLARTEEKLLALEVDRTNMMERINKQSEKIETLNDNVKENSRFTSNLSKLFWIVITVVIGIILKGYPLLF